MEIFGASIFGNSKVETQAQKIAQAEDSYNKTAPGHKLEAAYALDKIIQEVDFEDRKDVFDRVHKIEKAQGIKSRVDVDCWLGACELKFDKSMRAEMILEAEDGVRKSANASPNEKVEATRKLLKSLENIPADQKKEIFDQVSDADKKKNQKSLVYHRESDWSSEERINVDDKIWFDLRRNELLSVMPDAEAKARTFATEINDKRLFGNIKNDFKSALLTADKLANAQEFVDLVNSHLKVGHLELNGTAEPPDFKREGFHAWFVKRGDAWDRHTDQLTVWKPAPKKIEFDSNEYCKSEVKEPDWTDWVTSPLDTKARLDKIAKHVDALELAEQAVRDSANDPAQHMKRMDAMLETVKPLWNADQGLVLKELNARNNAKKLESVMEYSPWCSINLTEKSTKQYEADRHRLRVQEFMKSFPDAEQTAQRLAEMIDKNGSFGTDADKAALEAGFTKAKLDGSLFSDMINERLKALQKDPEKQYSIFHGIHISATQKTLTNEKSFSMSGPRIWLQQGPKGDERSVGEIDVKD